MKIFNYPYIVSWNITNKCNLSCKHCNLDYNKKSKDLTTKEIYEIIDKIKNNIFMVSFSGGEPLVREDFFDILKYLNNCKINSLLATNGMLINDINISEMKNQGMRAIAVSLDSHIQEKHDFIRGYGSYKKAIKSIDYIKKEGIGLIVSTTVNKENLLDLFEFLMFAYTLGADKVKIQVIVKNDIHNDYNLSLTSKELKYLGCLIAKFEEEMQLKDYINFSCYTNYLKYYNNKDKNNINVCSSNGRKMIIQSNGDVIACELYSQYKYGNMLRNTLLEICTESNNSFFTSHRHFTGNCKSCENLSHCKGGCKAFSIESSLESNVFEDTKCPIRTVR